ncbi:hypothetical protein H8Z60_19790 [Mycolicibacterium fortuitum]|nr:hypothetical protein [Mycolicibacterium fortuitum]
MNPVDALWDVVAAVGRAVADGFTLAAEVLCPRDHSCEERLRSWEAAAVAVEDEICDEAETCEGVDLLCTCGHPSGDHYRAGGLIDPCGKCDCLDLTYKSSAAVSAAADPSPTVPNAHSVVGDCPGSDSVILPTVEPGPQTAVETGHDMGLNWACEMFPQHQKHAPSRADASAPPAVSAQTCSSDGRADAVAIAESVTHEDLYMHLVRAAHRANTGHVDVLIEEFTNSLLTDFSIVKREGK